MSGAAIATVVLGAGAFLFATPGSAVASCPNEAIRTEQHATALPDCRAYEMVSPPDKNGGNLIADSSRTRAAADGSAIGFESLTPFGDTQGSSASTEYMAIRSTAGPGPLGTGWATHAITPKQDALTFSQFNGGFEPLYKGEFASGLQVGVFSQFSPLTEEPDVANVANLYLRTDLRSPGPGSYQLLTACPRCREIDEKEGPGKGALPPPGNVAQAFALSPRLADLSPDGKKALFESAQRLTKDTPVGSFPHLFESEDGAVRLAGRVPSNLATESECDDAPGAAVPACKANGAQASFAGQGASNDVLTTGVLSDGSDGHSRAFFTFPTENGTTVASGGTHGGRLYLREDGHYTSELNAPEGVASSFAPAFFWDASANGERAFFTSAQPLTSGAPGNEQLYMYDATKPGSDPHNLTLLSVDHEPADVPGGVDGVVGASRDGSYVYFIASGQLVAGAPPLGSEQGLYLWHEGTLSFIEAFPIGLRPGSLVTGENFGFNIHQTRVSPDGTHLLYRNLLGGQVQLLLYDATASTPTEPDVLCASCLSGGAASSKESSDVVRALKGAANLSTHENHALSDDGRYVFFNTAAPLLPEDTNGKEDAYEYDSQTEEVHLLSSGTSEEPSWFLDASAAGKDAFILTEQQLLGWDPDHAYDLYDVRVNGGFPEPPQKSAPCSPADTCPEPLGPVPNPTPVGSTVELPGNPKSEPPKTCPKGKRSKKVKGRTVCVKPPKHHKRHARANRGGAK